MRIYRCLCTQDKTSKKTFVDFAFTPEEDPRKVTFEPSVKNVLSHADLFKLRQQKSPNIEKYLPPLFLYDDDGTISVAGAKKLSPKDTLCLKKFETTIKASYQKFLYQNKRNSLSGRLVDEKDLQLTVNSREAAERQAEAQWETYNNAKKRGKFDVRFIDLPPQR